MPPPPAPQPGPTPPPPQRDWIAIAVSGLPGLASLLAVVIAYGSIHATYAQLQIAQQGQITDRYNATITNLGNPSIEIRLGGMYALQRLMHDSPRDQPTVIAVLCAFIRNRTAKPQPSPASPIRPETDVQAALTVIATRNTANDGHTTVDLDHTHLAGADLTGADLGGADLEDAHLNGAHLGRAHLGGADFTGTDVTGVKGMRTRTPPP